MKFLKSLFFVALLTWAFSSCLNPKGRKTSLEVIDNYRHYYPVLRGQKLDILFTLKNTGKYPFVMSDILTSCGCLVISKESSIDVIPAGEERRLKLTYNSAKNIGYVKHYITLYGNFDSTSKKEIVFDVNVVPQGHYTRDYEEIYEQERSKAKGLVEGNEKTKGYYMDSDFE